METSSNLNAVFVQESNLRWRIKAIILIMAIKQTKRQTSTHTPLSYKHTGNLRN